MSKNSAIEWCHHTFNPWWGCVKVSEGCRNCYADTWSRRTGHDVWGPDADRRFFGDKHWDEPRKWDRLAREAGVRERVFCGSMCDVFEDRPDLEELRVRLWRLIEETPNLDWLLLTKRPENIRRLSPSLGPNAGIAPEWMPDNVWLGTSVEDQAAADERIPHLLRCPAAVRFLSCEPLLGAVDVSVWLGRRNCGACHPEPCPPGSHGRAKGVEWVIAGGESGHHARPPHPDWFRSLRDQCVDAGVPFHFKQWGQWLAIDQMTPEQLDTVDLDALHDADRVDIDTHVGLSLCRFRKKAETGRLLDGVEHNGFPEVRHA